MLLLCEQLSNCYYFNTLAGWFNGYYKHVQTSFVIILLVVESDLSETYLRLPQLQLPQHEICIKIDNTIIPQVSNVKFLGVMVDQHLTWSDHIKLIATKIGKNVGIISRLAYILPTKIRLSLYYTLVHPYLSYCNFIWASNYKSRIQRLIILQKRVIRIIMGSPFNSHTHLLFKQLNILTLEQITQLQISEFMHRYNFNTLPFEFKNYFKKTSDFHSHFTRNANTYRSEFARTNSRKFVITYKGPVVWNNLPLELRTIPNRNSFKKQFKHWIINQTAA
jgi:hypothetical protein